MGETHCIGAIFDMDGVIVNNMRYHRKAWEIFFEKYHPGLSLEKFMQHFGRTNRDLLKLLFGEGLSPEDAARYEAEKEAIYRRIYASDIMPTRGFVEFLEDLKRKGMKTAVATSAPKENLEFVFKHIDVRGYFDVLLDASEVTRGKPDPEIYLRAAEKLGCRPADCLVFEDSLAGVEAARNAGMKVVGLATTNPPEKLRRTDMIIKDFSEMSVERTFALVNA